MKIKLSKPIKLGEEEITEIELREPIAGDLIHCGYPLKIGNDDATPDAAAIGALISRLSGIPPSAVKQLSVPDFQKCLQEVLTFFGE